MIDLVDLVLIILTVWSIVNVMRTRNVNIQLSNLEQSVRIRIQQEETQLYIWNAITEEFISQGKDLDEAMEKAILRFPNTTFVLEEKNNEVTH